MSRVKAFVSNPIGRAITAGLLLLFVVWLGKLYYQQQQETDAERRDNATSELDETAEKLKERWSKGGAEQEAMRAQLEEQRGQWFPASFGCGPDPVAMPPSPFWRSTLALPKDGKSKLRFAYRADLKGESLTLWSRRDVDCDGFYEIHRVEVDMSLPDFVAGSTRSQNLGE